MLTIALSYRREVHELERRKREREKKREIRAKQEERDRQERMMQILGQNPMAALAMQGGGGLQNQMMSMPSQRQAPPADQSGNPYAPSGGR